MNMPADKRPGRFGYFAAVLLAVGGVVACAALIVLFIARLDSGTRFVAPGSHTVSVKKAGTHVIWNDYRTVFEGRAFSAPEQLPDGLQIRVTDASTGKDLDIKSDHGASSKTPEAERVSIASFEAEPGRYTITILGNFPPRVFSVAPSFLVQLFGTIIGAIALMFFCIAAALALAIWTFLRRHPSTAVAATQPAPAAAAPASPVIVVQATPEESARQAAIAVYALQSASFLVVISMIAGVILSYVKRDDAAGTWLESHYTWQIRTFWWWLTWMIVAAVLAIIVVGIAVAIVNQIWLLYRIIKGWLRLSERRPMY